MRGAASPRVLCNGCVVNFPGAGLLGAAPVGSGLLPPEAALLCVQDVPAGRRLGRQNGFRCVLGHDFAHG
jgi:hypothetical protein